MDKIINSIEAQKNKPQIIIEIETEYRNVIANLNEKKDNLLEINL